MKPWGSGTAFFSRGVGVSHPGVRGPKQRQRVELEDISRLFLRMTCQRKVPDTKALFVNPGCVTRRHNPGYLLPGKGSGIERSGAVVWGLFGSPCFRLWPSPCSPSVRRART